MRTGHDIAMSLRAAYFAMHRQTNAALANSGITADQFVLLDVLAEGDGITQQELVRRTWSDPNTIRAMLVILERSGLVARGQHPTDGRAHNVTFTNKGRKTFAKLWTDSEPLRKRLCGLFRPEQVEQLIQSLERISATPAPASVRERRSGTLSAVER